MDFHSLTRKELQALCKLNKIPANLTNVAMADSLSALENVEGLEGILNPSQSGPDETTMIGTPGGPRTSCRTSTRPRKPVVKEHMEVSQSLTRTRRATREVVEEEKEEISDLPSKTPAARSTLRRAPVPSAAKKTEIGSVQRAYSTRRSVKLLEETMEKMCLGNDVSVTTDESSKEVSSMKIEEGSPEMQMELKYDVYDVVKEDMVDAKNETIFEEVIDCEPVSELSNEFQSSIIMEVEVSDEVQENVEAISSNASAAVTIEEEEEEVSLKLESPVEKSTLGDWVGVANNGGDIDDVKAEVVQSDSSIEKDQYDTKEESSEDDEIKSVEAIELPSESVTEKETSEPISKDEENEETLLVDFKDSFQAKFDVILESVTTESDVKIVEVEENKSFDATQFPRPSLPKPSKSLAEAHPVIQKIANVLDEDKEEENEVKKTDMKKLEDRSLRELHKLLKTKLQITTEKKEATTTRIALQSLPENRLAVNEQKD